MDIQKTKKLLEDCIAAEFSLDELKEYLSSDLSKTPAEWVKAKDGRSDQEMKEFLDDKFQKK